MEADKWNTALYHQLKEEDFYRDKQGEKMYFAEWDSYLTNMTSTHYQDILLAEIKKQIVQKGLDGVFLDTVGNINSYLPEDEQKWQNEAMLSFIQQIKNVIPIYLLLKIGAFKHLPIIQRHMLTLLCGRIFLILW